MAIYHLNMRSIGRNHAAGSFGAHVRYITRPDAEPELVLSQHMPADRWQARHWCNQQEAAARKNARLADKLNVALPLELTDAQRRELAADFTRRLTEERVPAYAVVHQKGKDAANPHLHLVIRDQDPETGKRHLRFSDSPRDRKKDGLEPNAVEHTRKVWEDVANEHLARHGHEARIDRRTLEAQKIDREPTVHIGPNAQAMEANGQAVESKDRSVAAAFDGARRAPKTYRDPDDPRARQVNYASEIDQGRTRAQYNAFIHAENRRRDERARAASGPSWDIERSRPDFDLAAGRDRMAEQVRAKRDADLRARMEKLRREIIETGDEVTRDRGRGRDGPKR